jgi:DNA-binding XRE family transcriptional regulator
LDLQVCGLELPLQLRDEFDETFGVDASFADILDEFVAGVHADKLSNARLRSCASFHKLSPRGLALLAPAHGTDWTATGALPAPGVRRPMANQEVNMTTTNSSERVSKPLGKRIFDRRMSLNLTQQQLAARAGLSEDGVKSIEQGRRPNPQLFSIVKIAAALGVTLDELVTEPAPLAH